MVFKSLLRDFMAVFPVVGPHAGIEAELMLAGKKSLTWVFVDPDDTKYDDWRMKKAHEGRIRLDEAVSKGKLIATDVERRYFDHTQIFRHYAQPENRNQLEIIAEFNKKAFNGEDVATVDLGKDIGHYLGYRKRDVFFFSHILNNRFMPSFLVKKLVDINAPFQKAYREKLLEQVGCDPKMWMQDVQKLENTL